MLVSSLACSSRGASCLHRPWMGYLKNGLLKQHLNHKINRGMKVILHLNKDCLNWFIHKKNCNKALKMAWQHLVFTWKQDVNILTCKMYSYEGQVHATLASSMLVLIFMGILSILCHQFGFLRSIPTPLAEEGSALRCLI